MIDERLRTAVETYNEYRSPMATAIVLNAGDREFRVRFEGPFHRSCCRDDYVDDLRYELDAVGVPADAIDVRLLERTGLDAFVATFAVDDGAVGGDDRRPDRRAR